MPRKPGKKLGEFVTLRLESDLKAALEAAAAEDERSIGQTVRRLLREGLERRREGRGAPAKTPSKTR